MTVTVAGQSVTVPVDGPIGLRIGGDDAANPLRLTVAGQTLAGTFWFEQVTAGTTRTLKISISGASFFLGDDKGNALPGDDVGFRLTIPSGAFLVTPTGMAGSITATVDPAPLASLPFTLGTLSVTLELNTMPTAAVDAGLGINLPAGRFLRVTVTTDLTIAGQVLSGTFMVEQVSSAGADRVLNTTDDVKILKIAAIHVGLFIGAPGTAAGDVGDEIGVSISEGTALFLVTPDGIAGRVSATASLLLGDGISPVTAGVVVEINQLRRTVAAKVMPVAVDEQFVVDGQVLSLTLPAGPYFSAALTGLSLDIGGQRFTTDLRVESRTRLNADGSIPASPATDLTVSFANLGLRLGSAERDVVVVSNGSGTLKIIGATAGRQGRRRRARRRHRRHRRPGRRVLRQLRGAAQHHARHPDAADRRRRHPRHRRRRLHPGRARRARGRQRRQPRGRRPAPHRVVHLPEERGHRRGHHRPEERRARARQRHHHLRHRHDHHRRHHGRARAGRRGRRHRGPGHRRPRAERRRSAATSRSPRRSPPSSCSTRRPAWSTSSIDVDGSPVTLNAPAGPYVRVTVGVGAPISVTIKGQTLQARVVFEQRTTSAGTKVVRVAFTDVSLFLGDPTPRPDKPDGMGLQLTNGSGAILLTAAGIAGEVEGTVALVGLPVSISATLKLQVNNLGVPVAEIVQFAGVDTGDDHAGHRVGPRGADGHRHRDRRHLHARLRQERERQDRRERDHRAPRLERRRRRASRPPSRRSPARASP